MPALVSICILKMVRWVFFGSRPILLECSLINGQQIIDTCKARMSKTQRSRRAQPAVSSLMPTRLLDLNYRNGIDDLRLDVSPANAPYVTLSHCWGSNDCLKSSQFTTGTLDEVTKSILITSLLHNFQDTVIVIIRVLGVRYLWIDSLCIIQDSESDWQRESSRMTEICRNSVANIAAEPAASCQLPRRLVRTERRQAYKGLYP